MINTNYSRDADGRDQWKRRVNGSTSSGQFISDWCRQALQDHWRIQGHTYIHTYIQIYIAPKIVRTNLRRYATVLWPPRRDEFSDSAWSAITDDKKQNSWRQVTRHANLIRRMLPGGSNQFQIRWRRRLNTGLAKGWHVENRAEFKSVEALGRIIIRGLYPASKNRMVGCWCGCLSGARCSQLYDLHINSMTYTLFFYSRLSVSKSILRMFP